MVTALADWLFYLHRPGISVAIFVLALSLVVALANPIRAGRIALSAAPILVLAVLRRSRISARFRSSSRRSASRSRAVRPDDYRMAGAAAGEQIGDVAWMIIGGPFLLVADVGGGQRAAGRANAMQCAVAPIGSRPGWCRSPSAASSSLFAAANPAVIAQWFASHRMDRGGRPSDLQRMVFWLVVIAFA